MSKKLLHVVHGSHLYGLNHKDSDLDEYIVYSGKGKSRQKISGDMDVIKHSFESFLKHANKGVPQALEAMFARDEFVRVDNMKSYRNSYVSCGTEVINTYLRTIRKFCSGNEKIRTHGARLTLNLSSLIEYGRFNPTLTASEVAFVRNLGYADDVTLKDTLEDVLGLKIFKETT